MRKLNELQQAHYDRIANVMRGQNINDIVRAIDEMTGMRWRGSRKDEIAYYYATAKVPDRLGCVFPQAARINLKKLAAKLI